MIDNKKDRCSNIELLRIFAIFGVIVLHYNNRNIGGALSFTREIEINHLCLCFLESIFVCSVNIFIIVSGFFLSNKNERYYFKIINLIVQVIVFSCIKYLLRIVFGNGVFSTSDFILSFLPNNYFVTLYSVLYLISPAINIVINKLSDVKIRMFLVMLFILFSISPFCVDVLKFITNRNLDGMSTIGLFGGSQNGYSIVNFILLYIIGACINKDFFSNLGSMKIILFSIIISGIITVIAYINEDLAWEYCSPFVIVLSALITLLFLKIKLKYNRIINYIAKSVFTCFLIHDLFLPYIGIKYFCQANIILMLIHILLSGIFIILCCCLIYCLWNIAFNFMMKVLHLDQKKLKFKL